VAPPAGGPHRPWALVVLELSGDRIAAWSSFLDTVAWFPLFGLPRELPPAGAEPPAAAAPGP
jgi:RNA polymerase sigma-70 factor (ECF subfamily)